MNSINKSLQYHFNHCLIYSNILIFSCLFPLCLVKFRDVCVFRKLTTVFFVLLPAIVFFISESLLSYWAFIHVAARVHTRSWCHIPADLSLKPFSSANFLRWTCFCSVVLYERTPPCGKGKQSFISARLKRPNLQLILPYFWVSLVSFDHLWIIFASAVNPHVGELHGMKVRSLNKPQCVY